MSVSLFSKPRRCCTEKTPSANACGARLVLYRALLHVAATFLVLHASRLIPGCHAAKQGHLLGEGGIFLDDGDGMILEEDSLQQGVIWNSGKSIKLEEQESIDLFEIKVAEDPLPRVSISLFLTVSMNRLCVKLPISPG